MPLVAVTPCVPTGLPVLRCRLWTIGGAPSSKCIRRSVSISRPLASARGTCDHSSAVSRSTLIAAFQSPRPCTRSAASDSAVGRSSFSWHTLALTASLGVALEAATSLPAVAAEVVLDSAAPHHSQLMWQVADVATAAGDATSTAAEAIAHTDWLTPVSSTLETVLGQLNSGLVALHVPYSYGWSIIGLTALVKLATYPFTKIQVESAINTQSLKPQTDLIKRRYGDDKERIQRETSALYERAGVNPLAGCFPTLATIPIFWGLFRSLTDAASSGTLSEGFYFIPSLSGPVSAAQRASGAGISWLYPLLPNGEPPIGWDEASRYLVLPLLLVIAQFISTAVITPKKTPEEIKEANPTVQLLIKVLPLLIGWFSLNLPSGLGLYYFSNTVFTTGQQLWLRRDQENRQLDVGPINVGQARHTGVPADPVVPFKISFPSTAAAGGEVPAVTQQKGAAPLALSEPTKESATAATDSFPSAAFDATPGEASESGMIGGDAPTAAAPLSMRCKRQRLRADTSDGSKSSERGQEPVAA